MNWKELQEMAEVILNNVPTGEYEDVSFSCNSGGAPVNRCGVSILYTNTEFAYTTTANGGAYHGEVVVRCRKTPAKDSKGRTIYEDENGTLFVFTYAHGDASSFDSGSLRSPVLV
jgi:hypothetical protein